MHFLSTPELFATVFDHTILKADATNAAIEALVAEALEFQFAAVCVNPCHVPFVARRLAGSSVKTCTVVGFPLGANLTLTKADEARHAISEGAQEIDMVINVGNYLSGEKAAVLDDIGSVLRACGQAASLKVIFETAYLSPEQIRDLARDCADMGVAFVKTSTGFGPRGASVEDVLAMAEGIASAARAGQTTSIKASGGIKDFAFTKQLIEAGATRIGASASVKILKEFSALPKSQ